MCREKGAVRHDDRLDCLSQGVQYYTEALSISAYETVKQYRQEDWLDLQEAFLDDPQQATQHMALGFSLDQRREARGHRGKSSVPTWV